MIFVGSDHAGFRMKEAVKKMLDARGHSFKDLGAFDESESDYPDYCFPVAQAVAKEKSLGLLFCGSGEGAVVCANKVKGVRAALVFDDYTARQCREHDDCNIACFATRIHSEKQVLKWVESFLAAKMIADVPRYARRVKKIEDFEKKWLK